MGAAVAGSALAGTVLPRSGYAATDMGIDQQPDSVLAWYREARFGMFLHWGAYAGPAQGEWYMERAGIKPDAYRAMVTSGSRAWLADQYNPTTWTDLAKQAGMRWMVLTARHHDGLALFPSSHPAAWTTSQAPWRHDFVADYVAAVRAAGLRLGLYYSPIDWQFPGYFDWTGADCKSNPFGWTTDPAHKENARQLKEMVYEQVRSLVTQYGVVDLLWWDGGWLGQQGSDRDAAFFWEPGRYRDTANQWQIAAAYGDTEPGTGKPLGVMGMVRQHQPDVMCTSRIGWIGDYATEEGSAVPSGSIRTQLTEKPFSVFANGNWGYDTTTGVLTYAQIMNVAVNSWVRDMNVCLNVGPDTHGVIVDRCAAPLRSVGAFLAANGDAVYGTRGGPWQPVTNQVGYTYRQNMVYVHVLPGMSGSSVTTPSLNGAQVRSVRQLATGASLTWTSAGTGINVTGIDRNRFPDDTVVAIELDRPWGGQPSPTATAGSTLAPGTYRIVNRNSGKPLAVAGGSAADGAKAVQQNGTATWAIATATGGSYTVRYVPSGKVLDVDAGSSATGLQLQQWTANGGTNQMWYLRPTGDGYHTIVSHDSGLLADVSGGATNDGAQVILWTANGGTNQQWQLVTA